MNNLTIKLTNEQQKQIKDATGKNLMELNIDLPAADDLTENELRQVSGGTGGASFDVLKLKPW
jgi:bacteriocin-like protein